MALCPTPPRPGMRWLRAHRQHAGPPGREGCPAEPDAADAGRDRRRQGGGREVVPGRGVVRRHRRAGRQGRRGDGGEGAVRAAHGEEGRHRVQRRRGEPAQPLRVVRRGPVGLPLHRPRRARPHYLARFSHHGVLPLRAHHGQALRLQPHLRVRSGHGPRSAGRAPTPVPAAHGDDAAERVARRGRAHELRRAARPVRPRQRVLPERSRRESRAADRPGARVLRHRPQDRGHVRDAAGELPEAVREVHGEARERQRSYGEPRGGQAQLSKV